MSSPLNLHTSTPTDALEPAPYEREDFDWSAWDLTDEDDLGHSLEQFACIQHLLAVLAYWQLERQRGDVFVGSDQFFMLHDSRPNSQISPDVYVVHGQPPTPQPRSWPFGGQRLLLAIEIVSEDWKKDYDDAPLKYQRLGAHELLLFDPAAAARPLRVRRLAPPHLHRAPCTLYRADHQGRLQRVEHGRQPIYSEILDAWFVTVPHHGAFALGLANDPHGLEPLPTRAQAEAQRAQAEALRAQAEAQRAEDADLRAEAEALRAEAEAQRANDADLRAQAEALRAQAEAQRAKHADLRAEAEAHRAARAEAERDALAEELRRLRAQLGTPTDD